MCRSRRELSNEYLLAKIGFDTAENEPLEVWGKLFNIFQSCPYLTLSNPQPRHLAQLPPQLARNEADAARARKEQDERKEAEAAAAARAAQKAAEAPRREEVSLSGTALPSENLLARRYRVQKLRCSSRFSSLIWISYSSRDSVIAVVGVGHISDYSERFRAHFR